MLDVLHHRGPDGEGIFQADARHGRVWLGHRRLAIIDLSPTGRQPMSLATRQRDLTVVFNGEIYNYAVLRDELLRAGYQFVGAGDTEVLLAAWDHWGTHALDRIQGMFAFAMWDAQSETLWLARDRMGEKPLYYHATTERIVFASELRSVLASGLVPRILDPDGLESFLAFGSVSQPYTLVNGVRMLEAGHVLTYHDGEIEVAEYWPRGQLHPEGAPPTRDEAITAVRAALDDALHRCMVADVPIALLLSGGVDSTAILARLTALGYDNLSTFSVGFDGVDAGLSEAKWALQASRRFGSRHEQVTLNGADARELIPAAMRAVDQPSFDGFNHYLVFQAIARAGFKVALTGQGADELFFGYARHRSFAVGRMVARLRAPEFMRRAAAQGFQFAAPDQQRFRKTVALFEPGSPTALAYSSRHQVFTGDEITRLLGRRVRPSVRFVSEPAGDTPLAQLYDMETRHFMRNQLLRDGDQMSMAVSLELRAPFVDQRLVETVTPMPTEIKVFPGRQKALLVDAVDDPLVAELSRRPKQGFPFPLQRWIAEELDGLTLDTATLGLAPSALREVAAKARRGATYPQYWSLAVLGSWMQANDMAPIPWD